jgi:cellulose synthase/poly-beta-1,6-N-acetylglucosamine synthase-like glycosyltransferase
VQVALVILLLSLMFGAYPYVIYPALLRLLALWRTPRKEHADPSEWPTISITVPVHNEEAVIRSTLDSLLGLDYPEDRRQILIVSDASTDGTDAIVADYAERGIEFMRLAERGGKTAAENAARAALRGDIVINTDATIRIHPQALKPLVAACCSPSVGVASGRDVSVARIDDNSNVGESGYVDYEMKLRALETRLYGIVGASGCFYAIRSELHNKAVPGGLSRDFAAALTAREAGYRAVSVEQAVCFVPRTGSLRSEYRRKVRTIARGIETLLHKRALLNPIRYGVFAWMLFSHKLCRWLVPWSGVVIAAALGVLATTQPWARAVLAAMALSVVLGVIGWLWPQGRRIPRICALPAYALVGNLAVLHAWTRVFRRELNPTWEPTRRDAGSVPSNEPSEPARS